jgi:putative component of membrane protein insertase Oxa1/YidC/SpoIIIJ protein YidD
MIRFCSQILIRFFRPLLGFSKQEGKRFTFCIYPITCTEYALAILDQQPFYKAVFLIAKRLLCCNPIGAWFLYRK